MTSHREHLVFGNFQRMQFLSALCSTLFFLSLPFAAISCVQIWLNCHNDVTSWASQGSQTEATHRRFETLFGGNEGIAISWPDANSDDPRLEKFAATLQGTKPPGLFRSVTSTPELRRTLSEEPLELSPDEISDRLIPWALGKDAQRGWILATSSARGAHNRRHLRQAILKACAECQISEGDLQIAGSSFWLAEVDRLSVESPLIVIPWIVAIVLICVRLRIGTWLVTATVIGLGIGASAITTALIHWCGIQMNAVLSTLPTLVFLICVANSLHLANHFLASQATNSVSSMRDAISITWQPTLFSGLTTSLGLLACW